MMDAFYEESAVNHNSKKGETKYKILHICSIVCLVIGILLLILFLFNFPFGAVGRTDLDETTAAILWLFGFAGFNGVFFMVFWFVLCKIKARVNVSYDYCFVSGELRISKVFNINKRRLVARIDCADMIQVGDIDNSSYERFKTDPMTKEIVCTSNDEAADGKFFMYVLANINGKKLYVLECRENLLMNIMKFAKRSVLESDYVIQERKQK
jgi:hypothetical protein